MQFGRTLLLLLIGLSTIGQARAAESIALSRLEGAAGIDATDRIVAGGFAGQFVPEPFAALVPSPAGGTWYRLSLVSDWDETAPPLLTIGDPAGLEVRAYMPPDYKGHESSIAGGGNPAGFSGHDLVFPLPGTLRADEPVYLHVAPATAVPRPLSVTSVTAFRTADVVRTRLDVLFPAVQIATILVMLAFFLALRDRMYAHFVGYAVCLLLFEILSSGLAYDLPGLAWLGVFGLGAVWLSALAGLAFDIEFTRRFLDTRRRLPRLDVVLGALQWPILVVAGCALIPVLTRNGWIESAATLVFLAGIPLLTVTALKSWWHGMRHSAIYLVAWSPGFILVVLRVLQMRLEWPLPGWLEFGIPAALAFANLVIAYGLAESTLAVRHERDAAHRLAERDPLTGLLNRRAIQQRLRTAFAHARLAGMPLSVLFIDIDHFKRINDSYGHRAGDECLRAVVVPIERELRHGDLMGRYGGEEFVVVLANTTDAQAEAVAERIRNRVQNEPLLVSGIRIELTVSIGVAMADATARTSDDLIERADAALYRAKSSGRNLVVKLVEPVSFVAGSETVH